MTTQMDEYDHPTKALYDSIIHAFEFGSDTMNEKLTTAFLAGVISPAVFINPERERVRTPEAKLDTRQIHLQGVHLSYLWAVCYFMAKLQELTYDSAAVSEPLDKPTITVKLGKLSPVLSWAISLKSRGWSIWPEFLPSPGEETDDVLYTNALFLATTRYLMYHEAAHLILHSDIIEFISKCRASANLSNEDARRLRNMELQADDFALDCSVTVGEPEVQKYTKVLGAIIAHLSNFFLLREPNTKGGTHPDIDDRLKRVLKAAKFNEELFGVYSELTWTIGVQVFLHVHNRTDELSRLQNKRPYETFDELAGALFDILATLKAGN